MRPTRHPQPARSNQPQLDENDRLDDREHEIAENHATIGPHVVHEAIACEGRADLERPPSALAWSGLAAGLSMGFSLVAEGLLRAHLPEAEWSKVISKFGYCAGFLIVVLGRQQLFTETTLTAVLPVLDRRDRETFLKMLRLWAIVLASNLAGALVFSFVLFHTELFDPQVKRIFTDISREGLSHTMGLTVLRGIFAGWLIALMVWLLPAAHHNRFHVIVFLTWLVGLGGFVHVVAGASDAFYLWWSGLLAGSQVIAEFLAPTLVGNVIGGVSLVAMLNHKQVDPHG